MFSGAMESSTARWTGLELMQFRIADTFTDSLTKLTGKEQKAIKTTAFDLQLNPASPGMNFEKLSGARDKNFWSVRVNRDIRMIVHRTANSLLLCYVDHHDDAYQWAKRRKLETHPTTGAAQLVEVRETVREIVTPATSTAELPGLAKPIPLAGATDELLLGYGVPVEWLAEVRKADEDGILQVADHLPAEAGEALLELAIGRRPPLPVVAGEGADPFEHPDAQRRFRVMADADELAAALEYPWEKWTVFLHPAQRRLVEGDYAGPARVCGSAGTGKTIVALHRAVYLARAHPEARVLLTTFSGALANALRIKLRRLLSGSPRLAERLEVHAMSAIGQRLYESRLGVLKMASRKDVENLLARASGGADAPKFNPRFLVGEWWDVVDAWQLQTWEQYRDIKRLGRKTRLSERQRTALWSIFEKVRAGLDERGLMTRAAMFSALAGNLGKSAKAPFDFAVIDEAQDVSVSQLRFLAALGKGRPNSLFFAGDLGQRIFQTPFSWKSLGVDIRGRSHTLGVNYRTSHQIRTWTDRLLNPSTADVDGIVQERRGTVSVFNGPRPVIEVFEDDEREAAAVGTWLAGLGEAGVLPHEIGVFVRSDEQLRRAEAALRASALRYEVLDEHVETTTGRASVGVMHLAKGLEFRAVAVMACDDEVIPLQRRIESITDDADLEEVYDTERHLLYVACTRARDQLLVTGVDPASEFLDDLRG